jgi:bisphosphoglycerate-independent phosphoglycerate mutase (AlkP superfamily)
VPCIYIGQQTISVSPHMHPSLKDIAPTILSLLNIPIPTQMTGNVLFV